MPRSAPLRPCRQRSVPHLGSAVDDPNRAHLSPKRNRRWLKALYFTPALFVIYSRAAAAASCAYPPAMHAINPDDAAGWTTRMGRHAVWEFLFLWSNFHQKHHALPGAPFYRLPELHPLSQPFTARRGLATLRYRDLLWEYLVRNKPPHSLWHG